jgi:hypothetical protein
MRHKKKSRLAAVERFLVLTATAALLIKAQSYALAWRGYFAVGGEFMLLLLPIIYYIVKQEIRDFAADIAELLRNAPRD